MSMDWWPSSLAHVPKEDPWADEHVVLAEITSFDDGPTSAPGVKSRCWCRWTSSTHCVSTLRRLASRYRINGPRPFPTKKPYKPRFWIAAQEDVRERYEPLVLSWSSHNNTVLAPDLGFLMTYELVSRVVADGTVIWDDLTGPVRDVLGAEVVAA